MRTLYVKHVAGISVIVQRLYIRQTALSCGHHLDCVTNYQTVRILFLPTINTWFGGALALQREPFLYALVAAR